MTTEERITIELATLGRPFQLGMLYDCRNDSLIPGMTLWDMDTLNKDVDLRSQHNTEFQIIASDSIEDKSSALNIEASLKASFLGGLVEVKGSAKYLKDTKSSKHQARVTLHYRTTTKFMQLTMKQLGRGNVQHPYVFDQGIATHVVTAVLYGAQAFFVFDSDVSSGEDHQDIQGNLQMDKSPQFLRQSKFLEYLVQKEKMEFLFTLSSIIQLCFLTTNSLKMMMRTRIVMMTSVITAYEISYQDGLTLPYSITIIDTPGFGDTRGITRDRMITEQIRQFFSTPSGVDTIDAVCFVTQASLARLTHAQKYVFDSILSIFGKDIAENILMLVTFADGQIPPVLEAIKVSGVPCPKRKNGIPVHFKFNNSALFADNKFSKNDDENKDCDDDDDDDGEDNFDRMFWKMGVKSMKNFFDSLVKLQTKSLRLTKEFLKECKHLEAAVEGLQPQVQVGLSKLDEIRKTRQIIEQHEAELSTKKDFEFEVELIKPQQVDISNSRYFITNCQTCHFTCHDPCGIPNDDGKKDCASMDSNGNCTACPMKCHWSVHFNQKYKWTYVKVKEKRTAQDLKDKYEKACGAKLSAQEIIKKQSEEIQELEDAVIRLIDESSHCLAHLQEIALKPNPLSTPEYIELLIEGEKEEAKPGYLDRIKALQTMKEQASIIDNVSRNETPNQAQPNRKQEGKSKNKNVAALWRWITGSDNSDTK
ncbi:UNVERIFIED_CONTAM: hypothetical protein FKN15_030595 [Acipenser sinensis]